MTPSHISLPDTTRALPSCEVICGFRHIHRSSCWAGTFDTVATPSREGGEESRVCLFIISALCRGLSLCGLPGGGV